MTYKGTQLLRRFLHAKKRMLLSALLLEVGANVCVAALSLLLAQALASFFGFRSLRGSALGLPNFDTQSLLSALLALIAFKLLLDYARFRLRGMLAEQFVHEIRLLVFKKHLDSDIIQHESKETGNKLLRFSGDLGALQRLISRGVLQFVADLSLILLGCSLIAFLSPLLATSIAFLMLVAFWSHSFLNKRIKILEEDRRGKKAKLLSSVSTTLRHLQSIQAQNRSQRFERRFEQRALNVLNSGQQYHRTAAWAESISPFFVQLMLLIVLCFGGGFVLEANDLFAVALILMTWRTPLSRLLRVGVIWEKGLLSLEKTAQTLDRSGVQQGQDELKKSASTIFSATNLKWSWGDKVLFEKIDFVLELGKTTAVVLPTGGGKTTITRILAGLYPAGDAAIFWGDQSLKQTSMHSHRRQMAFVSEAFPLIGRSISDSLSNNSAKSDIDDATAAFIQWQSEFPALQHVNDTSKVREGAPAFSSGQQVILQCLRAVLSKKPFLILDDPFRHLDADSAEKLAQLLLQHSRKKAILLLTTAIGPCESRLLNRNGLDPAGP
jgi:ABC-type bacteriocin/lantibiotic exporter with double-glycine peptidase domain